MSLGSVELTAGYRVAGQVVDPLGEPVPKTNVSINGLPIQLPGLEFGRTSLSGSSDEQGNFEIHGLVPAGTWEVDIGDWNGYGNDDHPGISIGENHQNESVQINVHELPHISGVVVDEVGEPIWGAYVSATDTSPQRSSDKSLMSWTNAKGQFQINKRYPEAAAVQLSIEHGIAEAWQSDQAVDWGASDIRIQTRRSRSFDVRVIERDTGHAITRYDLRPTNLSSSSLAGSDTREVNVDSNGMSNLSQSPAGAFRLTAIPHDPQYWVRNPVLVSESHDLGQVIELEVERLAPVDILVIDDNATPQAHASITIFDRSHKLNGRLDRFRANTDSNGRATVYVPNDIPFEVELAISNHKRQRMQWQVDTESTNTLVIGLGTPVTLTLSQPTAWRDAQLYLRSLSTNSRKDNARLNFDAQYASASTHAPPGRYALDLVSNGLSSDRRAGPIAQGITEIVVPESGQVHQTIDLSAFEPAELSGQIWLDSSPAKHGMISAIIQTSGATELAGLGRIHFRSEAVAVDDAGRFNFSTLPPGTARLEYHPVSAEINWDNSPEAVSVQAFELSAGATSHIQLDLSLESVTFQATTDRGYPVITDPWVVWRDGVRLCELLSNLRTKLSLIGCGPGSYEVEIRGKRYGPFVVEPGQEWTEFKVELRDD